MLRLPTFEAQLARQILIAAGATACLAVACGDDGEGSGGGGGSSTTTTGGSTTSTKSSTTVTSTSTSTTSTSTSTGMGGAGGGHEGGGGGGAGVERCWFPVLKGQEPCPPLDMAGMYYACTNDGELVGEWISGPQPQLEQCCYIVEVGPPNDPNCAVIGRPLVVEGRAARAGVARGDRGWAGRALGSSKPSVAGLDPKTRALLARAWADDAAYEHASVASFSKLSLELMAFGAPSDLVRAAHEAALDEIRHAELGFALASAYAGEALSPSALPEAARLSLATDIASLAAAAVKEGCVGETLAALVASAQHDVATDEAVRSALNVVRADEGRHAELAWKLVAWALRAGGEDVRAAVESAFEEAAQELYASRAEGTWSAHAHGRLSDVEAKAARVRGLELVVRPAMQALLA